MTQGGRERGQASLLDMRIRDCSMTEIAQVDVD
jgi:hypothetical protein